jgi:hypothetical protein
MRMDQDSEGDAITVYSPEIEYEFDWPPPPVLVLPPTPIPTAAPPTPLSAAARTIRTYPLVPATGRDATTIGGSNLWAPSLVRRTDETESVAQSYVALYRALITVGGRAEAAAAAAEAQAPQVPPRVWVWVDPNDPQSTHFLVPAIEFTPLVINTVLCIIWVVLFSCGVVQPTK